MRFWQWVGSFLFNWILCRQNHEQLGQGIGLTGYGNLPFFHGVLTKDKLFSIEDAAGKRQWVPLGRRIDGWTLKSYDEKREALTLSRLGQSVELVLHKAIIVDAPAPQVAVSRTNTTITVKPGAKTLLGGGGGRTIVLEAEILDLSK